MFKKLINKSFRKKESGLQIKEILAVVFLLGITITLMDYVSNRVNYDGTIARNQAGQGDRAETLDLYIDGEKKSIDVEVSEIRLSPEEIEKNFEKAKREIDETYLGHNKDSNAVTHDLDIRDSYVDKMVDATWFFDDYHCLSPEGKIEMEKVPEEGQVITANVRLNYEGEEQIYVFSFVVRPFDQDTIEGKFYSASNLVKETDESTRDKNILQLPDQMADTKLLWKKKMDYRGLQLIIIALLAVVGVFLGQKQDEKKEHENLIQKRISDYPMIVSDLSILMGAGMSFRRAIERMSLKSGRSGGGYELINRTHKRIKDGVGELAAIEMMGKESECKEYRKLANILCQNLRQGSKTLIDSLEQEEILAFDMKKRQAIQAGEKASTKLLLPMGGMLFVIMIIIVVPAILQMKG
ncbi:MAG: type II secretion system F family protein [Pseudobutyrivibrio sp.]|nr:type II secretion system F family protein [Pseudobutyrivibrio sp.]